MKDLFTRVEKLGLKINEQETARISAHGAFIADYSYRDVNIVARYIFTCANCETFEKYMQEHSSFTKEVVEPVFYSLRNDLRWNLYLVCVMDAGEFHKLPENEIIKFRTNKDFTRNIVIPVDRLEDEIPAGKMALCVSNNIINKAMNPLSVWSSQLSDDLQFCLNGYESKMYNSYIEGGSVHLVRAKKHSSGFQTDYVNRMNSLILTDHFRPHCFGARRDLPFSRVNILAGANGSGKTSIFQAIELIMTGVIRVSENRLSSDESNSQVFIWHNNFKERKVEIPKDAGERKSRQSMWYNDKSDKDTAQSLNNSFHIFNMFTPEDVFRVSFSKEKEEYANIFTKMLFGEDAETAQKSWKKYKDEFRRAYKANQNILTELHQQMSAMEFPHEIKKDGILENIRAIGLYAKPDFAVVQIRDMIIEVKHLCHTTSSFPEVHSMEQLNCLRSQKKLEIDKHKKKIEALEVAIKNEMAQLENQAVEQERLFDETNRIAGEQGIIENAQSYLPGFRFIADNYDGLCELDKKRTEWSSKKSEINMLTNYAREHGHIGDFSGVYATYESSSVRHDVVISKLHELRAKEVELDKKHEKLEKAKNDAENAVNNIKAYGSIYIDSTIEFNGCPLCGNQDISIDEVRAYLKSDACETNSILMDVIEKRTQVKNEINHLNEELAQLQMKVACLKEIDIAYMAISEASLTSSHAMLDKLDIVKNYIRHCKKSISDFDVLSKAIKTEEAQYEDAAPQRVQSVLDNGNFLGYISMIENNLGITGENNNPIPNKISRIVSIVQNKQKELDVQRTAIEEQKLKLSALFNDVERNREQLNKELNALRGASNSLHQELLALDKLDEFFVEIQKYMSANISLIDRTALVRQCLDLEKMIDDFFAQENARKEKNKLETKISDIEIVQKRLGDAIEKISSLQETRKYADDFIRDNIERISEIFHTLHTPQEFSKLDIVDNEVFAFRAKDSAKVALSSMSTGQKTAVALSIFLLLNSSMPSIPKIILIDEPIANIDDLNIVSFIDVIRELAICGDRQIFVTTANDNVRKLFRRKFSFMGDELSEINFKRASNMKAQITIKRYDDVRELSERTNIIQFDEDVK